MARKLIRNPPPFKRDLQKMSISVDFFIFFGGGAELRVMCCQVRKACVGSSLKVSSLLALV